VNSENAADIAPWEGTKAELDVVLAANPNIKVITRKVPRIKLATVLDENILVFDGYAPHAKKIWPFIPIFCFCETSFYDMKLKTQGLIRSLKDLQREKNKRRSNIMAAVGTLPTSGWMLPKGGVDDVNVLRNSAGAGKIIEYNSNKGAPTPIGPIEISQSLVQLEMMFGDDIRQVGANPDMLGMQQGKNDPGITIQLRQQQGMTAIQEVYDSLSYGTRMLGRKIIELIGECWDNQKIKRIAGDYLPFDDRRKEVQEEVKKMQAAYMQVQAPSSAGMVPENPDEERMLLDIETQQMAAENQKKGIQQQITDLEGLIQSITDEENKFWGQFDEIRKTSRFDVSVDETANTPTSRIADLASLTQAAQYGVAIPPEAIVELLNIPKNKKDLILQYIQQQQAMQQQMAQAAAMPKMPAGPAAGGPAGGPPPGPMQ
jgi:phosphopantetheine adenylyltransferase